MEVAMGYGTGMTPGMSLVGGFLSLALTVWFVVFTVLMLQKLDKIIELLERK
jgi:hypothetical protein